ncbi:MAG: hypothetical protein KC592_11185, partial [Nitrospira sp.]|nr:hypothetical protein [Nitrospira sp.]
VIFFELLTGSVPFSGESAAVIGMKHISQDIPRLPEDLLIFQRIIDKVLSKKREDRYQTGAELCSDISEIAETLSEDMLAQIGHRAGNDADGSGKNSGLVLSRNSGKRIRRRPSELNSSRTTAQRKKTGTRFVIGSLASLLVILLVYIAQGPYLERLFGSADDARESEVSNTTGLNNRERLPTDQDGVSALSNPESTDTANAPLSEPGPNEEDLRLNLLVLDYINKANDALQTKHLDEAQKYIELASALEPAEPWLIAMLEDAKSLRVQLHNQQETLSGLVDRVDALIDSGKYYYPADDNAYVALQMLETAENADPTEIANLRLRIESLSSRRISDLLTQGKLDQAVTEIDMLSNLAQPEVVTPLRQRYDILYKEIRKSRAEVARILDEAQRLEKSDLTTDDQRQQAVRLYQQALEIEAGNVAAQSGRDRVISLQMAAIMRDIEQGKLMNARKSLEVVKQFGLQPSGLALLETQLIQQESLRAGAIEKLEEARMILTGLEGWGIQAEDSPEVNRKYAGALIDAYRSSMTAQSIDASTPGIVETIKQIEAKYRSGFESQLKSAHYDSASVYVENMERSGINKRSAVMLLEEMGVALEEKTKVKRRSLPSF